MPISALRILPPLAIGRFGSSPTPLEAFELEVCPKAPLDFRRLVPKDTLEIDPGSGEVKGKYVPEAGQIRFKDCIDGVDRVRPVAPFLEVFAQTSEDTLDPLTLDLLAAEGIGLDALAWTVEVGNLKVFRQTGDVNDIVLASVPSFKDHGIHELRGMCLNFLEGKFISFGSVRYIKPTPTFSQIRLRFTPAAGKVYGAHEKRFDSETHEVDDPVFKDARDRIVYDTRRGSWRRFQSNVESKTLTNPSDIYQGIWPDPNKLPISWGYLDDVCDGPVTLTLTLKNGTRLTAHAWISACMPAFAPDSEPMRTVADELEQLILGPEIGDEEVSIDEAAEIVRRALETVRLMNTLAMNGNVIAGRANVASTLGRQDTNDLGRQFAPIMAASLADNFAVRALHERIYAALKAGSAPWFAAVLRRPEEIGDLSDASRRKMPPMLRGADGRAMTLTRRQISRIVKAATAGLFTDAQGGPRP